MTTTTCSADWQHIHHHKPLLNFCERCLLIEQHNIVHHYLKISIIKTQAWKDMPVVYHQNGMYYLTNLCNMIHQPLMGALVVLYSKEQPWWWEGIGSHCHVCSPLVIKIRTCTYQLRKWQSADTKHTNQPITIISASLVIWHRYVNN